MKSYLQALQSLKNPTSFGNLEPLQVQNLILPIIELVIHGYSYFFFRRTSVPIQKFPLLKLADLPLQKVLNCLELTDIVDLSTCSSKCKAVVRSLVRCKGYYSISLCKDDTSVLIYVNEGFPLSWKFVARKAEIEEELQPDERFGRRKINGVVVKKTVKNRSKNSFITITEDFEKCLRLIIDHLFDILPRPVNLFNLELSLIRDPKELVTWRHVKRCSFLKVHTNGEPPQELDALLENITVTNSVIIQDYGKRGVASEKILKLPNVDLEFALWITPEMFMESRCKNLQICYHDIHEYDLNQMMIEWYNGEREELESIILWRYGDAEAMILSIEEILGEGLPMEQVDLTRRSKYYNIEQSQTLVDCTVGSDIKRSDGKLATLVKSEYVYAFVVWHKTKHDYSKLSMNFWRQLRIDYPLYGLHTKEARVFTSDREAEEYAQSCLEL